MTKADELRSFWAFCATLPMMKKRKRLPRFLRWAWKPRERRDRWCEVKGQRARKISDTPEI